MNPDAVSLQDVRAADELLRGLVRRTPLIRSEFLSDLCHGEVYLKLENQQTTNSFKIRGALNRMLHLTPQQKEMGVVTASAGNHGQAVAVGAEALNTRAKIVVPGSAPTIKTCKIQGHNVQLLRHGNIYDEAEQEALSLAKREKLTYISPYNDRLVIAGQGTVGLEILEQRPEVETIVIPVGGGGLIAGIGIVAKSLKPGINIIGVQSEASPAMYESLRAGKIVTAELQESIADGLFGNIEEGSITFPLTQTWVDDLVLVEETTIKRAICLLCTKENQVAEGAGAVATALLLESPNRFRGKHTVVVVSGGNIEEEQLRNLLSQDAGS